MHLFQIFSEDLSRKIHYQIKSAFGDFHSADMPSSCKQFAFSDTFFQDRERKYQSNQKSLLRICLDKDDEYAYILNKIIFPRERRN